MTWFEQSGEFERQAALDAARMQDNNASYTRRDFERWSQLPTEPIDHWQQFKQKFQIKE